MVFAFVLGVVAGMVAPFFAAIRYQCAQRLLAVGATVLAFFALVGLTHPDPSQGLAAVDANRREYLFVLACESPVLVLALWPHHAAS